ncbi:cadherin-99C, partial [Apis florea]|uniref:cadherin-99C n=1 Tax=Apis florea TaxID=7463 RepID=UPI0012FF2E46
FCVSEEINSFLYLAGGEKKKAVEVSEAKRSATAKLTITVKPVDSNPPIITASSIEGFVDENAPIGTKVIDKHGDPIVLTVSDADLGPDDPKPAYSFELTTNFFAIDPSGMLVVNEENLDRDPPSPGRFRFQVVAREKTGVAASAPLSFVVILNDVNDNAPMLPMIPPITVQAGETKKVVTKVEATDNDEGENAEITYSIYHVSNNGLHKFKIEPRTGVIESVRKLNAGEQFSITVQATDKGGKYSQTIVEVNVIPGPNTRSPVFQQPVYEVQVSEGASINSTVATITAVDPENDPVSYSIVSGNDLRQFAIGDKSGVITVIRKLDREDLTRYQLLIKAEDSGGLFSTATVNIKVTDINDKNPEFVGLPYEFSVKEGEARKLIGRVHAEDADEGINAEITYFAPDDIPFTVDPETGDVLTKIVLDYEQNDEYKFVVTARDGAPDYRLATATVTVKVIDVEDEVPVFHQSSYEARVKENIPDYTVLQVTADDPDTKKQITYMIKQGDTELFAIDSRTGVIKTTRGLDYERESQHILIIGTVENTSDLPGSTTRVVVNVQDVNDIPPVFTSVPRPITLDDDIPIGTTVINLIATDSDGTAPGNQVRYEIVGRGIANKYFMIDPDTGVLRVRDDLRKETDTEYQVDVRAYDMGEPQLSSVTTVPVYVRHVATVPPEIGLGFAENSYNVEVPEDAGDNTLIKIITIINSHAHDTTPLKCEIYSGNEDDLFEAGVTEERNCALKLKKGALDYETTESYQVKIKLESLSGLLNSGRNTTMVKIQVLDVNDNKPEFIFPENDPKLSRGRYFAAIPRSAQFGSTVIQVKAHDKDNGKYGKLEYRILGGRGSDYFAMDTSSGIIRTTATFDNVDPAELPFKFDVRVRDNPNSTDNFNSIVAPVIVNLIGEENLMILVVQDASPDTLQKEASKIAGIIEERSELLIGIDRIAVRKNLTKNGTIEMYPQDSDVWFYAIDPDTEAILDRNSSRIQRSIFEKTAMSNITFDVSTLVRANAIDIHAPVMPPEPIRTQTAIAFSGEVFPYALIIIACVILILGVAGIVYICVSWSRYKAYKERMQRMYVVPRYDPVYVEPNLKEYETQVLQMSVPVDDNDSYNDLQLDFSNKNHAFSLDNVSYITKDHGESTGQQSPVSSEAATTARASSIAGTHADTNIHSLRRSTLGRKNNGCNATATLNNHDATPVLNPLYNHGNDSLLSPSPSNDNVTFREKRDYSHLGFTYLGEQSPVETTTELIDDYLMPSKNDRHEVPENRSVHVQLIDMGKVYQNRLILAGCTVLMIGACLLLEPSKGHLLNLFVHDATPHDTINLIAYSLLGLGFTVLTVGFFGCRAALHGSQCILATYMSMLVALIVTELVTAAAGGIMTFRILSGLEERLISKLAVGYGHEPTSDIPFSHSLDFAQYKFNCCGIHGYGDYNGTAWWRDAQISGNRRQVPLTCCVLKNTEVKNTGSPMSVVSRVFNKHTEKPWLNPKPKDELACQIEDKEGHDGYRHQEGCLLKVTSWLQCESFTLVFLGMAMAGIQTFGIITSAFLCRTIREMQVD